MRTHSYRITPSILNVLVSVSMVSSILIVSTLAIPRPVIAADPSAHPICPLLVHQERIDSEERALEVDLAQSRLAASASIFQLVDQLWQKKVVERLVYLTAKHDHDVAEIEVKRQRLLLKRQEAEAEQFAIVCSPAANSDKTRTQLVDARQRYLEADCHRLGKDLAIAEVDMTYRTEVLKSFRDLRDNDVTSQQTIIRAERDLEIASKRVEHQRRRVQSCADDGDN